MRWVLPSVIAMSAACSFTGGSAAGDGDGDGDGDADAGIDAAGDGAVDAAVDAAPVVCEDWGTRRFFDPCAEPALFTNPESAPDLSVAGTYVIDTDAQEITDPDANTAALGSARTLTDAYGNATGVHLVVVGNLTVPDDVILRAVGGRPLILAATGDIQVDGIIDVSSRFSGGGTPLAGAGAGLIDDGFCSDAATLDGADDIDGGSGAGGGALAEVGGDGGDSDQGGTTGAGGGSSVAVAPMPLHGGCPGGQGGDGQGGAGGLGGPGGGAVLLSAAGAVVINGELRAGGAGGRGQTAPGRNGGGGGGSGGLVALEGGVTTNDSAAITSNGGGGGGGADESTNPDLHGEAGRADTTRALGGDGDDNGNGDTTGDGGAGGAGTNPSGFAGLDGQDDDFGGGGGGGSVGVILLLTVDPAGNPVVKGTFSPLARLDQPPYD